MLPSKLKEALQKVVSSDRLRDDPGACLTHSYDATPLFQTMPDGVIYPKSTEEIQKILSIASHYAFPVITRGSGTNLSASTVPTTGGLVMVMTHMDQLLEIDQENLTATFQPGLITQHLHDQVEKLGLFYPPDPGSMHISTMGGNIATSSGGLRGLKYGTTKDYVLGLTAVLPSGSLLKTGGKRYKDVAGYNLTQLLIGSEGTLAVITEATVKLLPLPEYRQVMVAHFADLDQAASTVSEIIAARIIPCTLEFLDQQTIQVIENYSHIGLPVDAEAILLIEQDGPRQVVLHDMVRMKEICQQQNATHVLVAENEEEGKKLLAARRNALSALARLRPTTILEDATVPRSQIAPMVREIRRISQKYNVQICTFGHAGDGNLHPTCLTDARDQEEIKRVEKALAEIFATAIQLGGTITGEHGVGLSKAPFLESQVGTLGIEVMKGIKKAFDPQNILNPGKIFADYTSL